MKSAVIVLAAVFASLLSVALVRTVPPQSAQATHLPAGSGNSSVALVKEGQLICVSTADSIATFRIEADGMLRKIDVDGWGVRGASPTNRTGEFQRVYGDDP